MKEYKITLNVSYNTTSQAYEISKPGSPSQRCYLCRSTYRRVVGREVVGKVTFILRKIKGKARDYIFPFRIFTDDLEMHEYFWLYQKAGGLLWDAFDFKKLKKWAGKSMFSIEVEW